MASSSTAKLARYAAVGFLTLAIYLVVGKTGERLGLATTWQVSLAFISAVGVNYLLQRSWVFADSRPARSSLPKYTVMISFGYLVNLLAVHMLAPRMPMTIALLVAVVLVVISNALLSFTWVFLVRDTQEVNRLALKERSAQPIRIAGSSTTPRVVDQSS
jgi:putative flippase GtrA